jgi:hypothetical protein
MDLTSTNGQITLGANVSSIGGDITFKASTDITQNADISSTGGEISLNAGTSITMADGTHTVDISDEHTGGIIYTAKQDIALSIIESDKSIQLKAESGNITDNLTSNENPNLIGKDIEIVLTANTGIGTSTEDIDTQIKALIAETISGGIFIQEVDDIIIPVSGILAQGAGTAMVLTTQNGSIEISGAIEAFGENNANVLIQANESDTNTEANIILNENITVEGGNISLIAADDIQQKAKGVMALTSEKTIDLSAGNAITMDSGTKMSTNAGNLRFVAGDSSSISLIDVRSDDDRDQKLLTGQDKWGVVSITTSGGSVVESGEDDNIVDIYTSELIVNTSESFGLLEKSNANAIDTEVAVLSGRINTSGGLNILDFSDVTIGTVSDVSVQRVNTDASTELQVDNTSISGLTSVSDGAIVLRSLNGTITIDQTIDANGLGNILIGAAKDIIVNSEIDSGQASISIIAGENIVQNKNITTGNVLESNPDVDSLSSGTIDLQAGNTITTPGSILASTINANIRYNAGTELSAGIFQAGKGDVSLNAGSIIDNNATDMNVTSANLRIETSAGSVGEIDDRFEITVDRLIANIQGGDLYIYDPEKIEINTVEDIVVNRVGLDGFIDQSNSPIDATLSGITSTGDVDIDVPTDGIIINHITSQGNVVLNASSGSILDHADDQLADITASNTISLTVSDHIQGKDTDNLLELGDNATLNAYSTLKGNINIHGLGNLTLEDVNTADGSIYVIAEKDIVSKTVSSTSEHLNPDDQSFITLTSTGGNITVDNSILAQSQGDILINTDTKNIVINGTVHSVGGNLSVISRDAITQNAQLLTESGKIEVQSVNDLTMTENGSTLSHTGDIRYQATEGNITVENSIKSNIQGDINIVTDTNNININGEVHAVDGYVSILSGNAITQNAKITTETDKIDVQSVNDLTMTENGSTLSHTGDIRYYATEGNITVENSIKSQTQGDINIITDTNNININGEIHAVDGYVSILSGNAITQNSKITTETDKIDVQSVNDLTMTENGLTLSHTGDIRYYATEGNITVENSIKSQTQGDINIITDTNNININGEVHAVDGYVSILSGNAITQNSKITTETDKIDLQSVNDLTMTENGSTLSHTGDIRYYATEGNITVENLIKSNIQGDINIITDTSNIYINGEIHAVDGYISILSGDEITQNGQLTTDSGKIEVQSVNDLTMTENGSTLSNNGYIRYYSTDGNITLENSVKAQSQGNILIHTDTQDIHLNGTVHSVDGHLSIISGRAITQKGQLITDGGTIDVKSINDITMTVDGSTLSNDGDIRYHSTEGNIALAGIQAQEGDVAIAADSGSIKGILEDGIADISAKTLLMNAGIDINPVETNVSILSANADNGNIRISDLNENDIAIDTVTVNVNRVETDGQTNTNTIDQVLSDITTAASGYISLTTKGNLTINDGDDDHLGIDASNGTGNVYINSAKSVSIQSAINGGTGSISILTDGSITQGSETNTDGDIITSENGTIDIYSHSNIFAYTGNITKTDANIRVYADQELSIGSIDAGSSDISLGATTVIDSGTDDMDITATNVMINPTDIAGGVGQKTNYIQTTVNTLSANVGQTGLFINESNKIIIDAVPEIGVNRITKDGQIDAENSPMDAAQANVHSVGEVHIVADLGDVLINYIGSESTIDVTSHHGSILETLIDDTADLKAGDNQHITLIADKRIAGPVPDNDTQDIYLDFADQSIVNADSLSLGDIRLRGCGTLVLNDVQTGHGLIDIVAKDDIHTISIDSDGGENDYILVHSLEGDILVGYINAVDIVTLVSDQGSIADDTNDTTVDIKTDQNALISLIAWNNIYGKTEDGQDNYLDFNDNSIIEAEIKNNGSINLRGDGALTLQNIQNPGGAINIIADEDIFAEKVINLNNENQATNDISITSTRGSIEAGLITSGRNMVMNAGESIIDKPGDITSNDIILKAVTGIGSQITPFHLNVNRLDAYNKSLNGMFVKNAKALTLADLDNNSWAVESDGYSDIVIQPVAGQLTIAGAIQSAGMGDILLFTQNDNDLLIQNKIISHAGNISLLSESDITINSQNTEEPVISTTGHGSIDIDANGDISILENNVISTKDSNIRLNAGENLSIASIDAGKGAVHLNAKDISVNGTNDSDVMASKLCITTPEPEGDNVSSDVAMKTSVDILSANITNSGLFINESDAITIDSTGDIKVNRVATDGTTNEIFTPEVATYPGIISTGTVDLDVQKGNVVINQIISSEDVFIDVLSGSIIDNADDTLTDISAGPSKTITLTVSGNIYGATTDDHLELNDGSIVKAYSTLKGNIRIAGTGQLTLQEVNTNDGSIHVIAENDILAVNVSSNSEYIYPEDESFIVISSTNGDMTIEESVKSQNKGNVLLSTDTGNININGEVNSVKGHISILSTDAVSQNALITTGGGTIDIQSVNNINMIEGSQTVSNNGDIKYNSTAGDITITDIQAQEGNLAIVADTGSIKDATDNEKEDILAHSLLMIAGADIDHIQTKVSVLSAKAGGAGDLVLTDLNEENLTIDTVTVRTNRVGTNGLIPETTNDISLSDLSITSDGSIALTTSGRLIINDGDSNGLGVDASQGSGNIYLSTPDDISIQSNIHGGTGSISILTDGSMTQGTSDSDTADILTTGTGTIDIYAKSSIESFTGNIIKADANIRIKSDSEIQISSIDAGKASISIIANNVIDSGTDDIDLNASNVRIESTESVGLIDSKLKTSVDTLSATVGTGGLFINETDGITIDTVDDIPINRILSNGQIDLENSPIDNTQSNVISKGDVEIYADSGDININYIEADGYVLVTANSGSILETLNDTTADIKAGEDKLITLTAKNQIKGPENTYFDLADNSILVASSISDGDILISGVGKLSLNDIQTTNGLIDIIAESTIQAIYVKSNGDETSIINIQNTSGDILTGSIQSAGNITITSDQGSIIDDSDDTIVDLTAGENASISLTAYLNINGTGENDTFIEVADNSKIFAKTTTNGSVGLRGLGALVLQDIEATGGEIHVIAENDIIAQQVVNVDINNDQLNDIILTTSKGSIEAYELSSYNNLKLTAGQSIIDKPGLISGKDAILSSVSGMGSISNVLTLDVNRLDAYNQSSNGIFVTNTKDLNLSDLNNDIFAVRNDSDGDIIILTLSGDIDVTNTVKSSENGDILLSTQAENSDIHINGDMITESGNISILATGNISQSTTILSGGTIDIDASNGFIAMTNGAKTQSSDSNIRYQAKANINIDQIHAGDANVSIHTETGFILGNQNDDIIHITAKNLRLESSKYIGNSDMHIHTSVETASAKASGHIFITDNASLTIGEVDIQDIQRVLSDGSLITINEESALTGIISDKEDSNIVIQTEDGDLFVNHSISTTGSGNVRLFGGSGSLRLNHEISTESGHMSLKAEKSILQNASISSTNGTIEVIAQDDITMNQGVITTTLDNHIVYESLEGNITIHQIDTHLGKVAAIALSGNISFLNSGSDNIIGNSLILKANAFSDAIQTNASFLSAESGGNLIVESTNTSGITIDEVTVSVNRIESDGKTQETKHSTTLSDISILNDSAFILNAVDSITVNDGDNDNIGIFANQGSGNILLKSNTSDISIQSKIDAGSGNISIIADTDILIGASDNTESNIVTSGPGTIDIESGRSISIFDGNTILSDGNIRIHAAGVMTIGSIQANQGSVSLSGTNIIDSGTNDIDITASQLRMINTALEGGAGTTNNMLQTSVDMISAHVNNAGLYIKETDGIKVDIVDDISVNRVGIDTSLETITDESQSNVVSIGDVHIYAVNGDISINQIISQGHVTLNADSGSIVDHADDNISDITAGESSLITLTVSEDIKGSKKEHYLELDDGSILKAYSTSTGDINIRGIGAVTLQELKNADGGINVFAEKDILIIDVLTQNGSVIATNTSGDILIDNIYAQGATILNSMTGSILETDIDIDADITSTKGMIILKAFSDIASVSGSDDTFLDFADQSVIQATSISKGKIHLRGEGSLLLSDIDTTDGEILAITYGRLYAFDVTSKGSEDDSITLYSLKEDIFVGQINSAEDIKLVAGQGDIIDYTDDDIVDIRSGQNSIISLHSKNDIHGTGENQYLEFYDNSIITAKASIEGDIKLKGAGSLILQNIEAIDGNIDVIAKNDIRAEQVISGGLLNDISIISNSGLIEAYTISSYNNIYMEAGQSIIDKAGLISGKDAVIKAKTGIAESTQFLTLDVNRLDAFNESTNGIFINNTKELILSDLNSDNFAIQNQADGDIVIVTLDGDLTTNDTVKASEKGDILLLTQGETHSILINNDILSDSGNISILADMQIEQSGNVISEGTIDFQATNGFISMTDGILTQAINSNIRYEAKGDILIEQIDAGSGDVSIYSETGNISGILAEDHVNIAANNLRLSSAKNIGDSNQHIQTLIETTAAISKGHIYITDHSTLAIGQIDPINIQRVQMDGSTSVIKDTQALAGMHSIGNDSHIVVQTLNGDLTAQNSVSTTGNIRLFAGEGSVLINDNISSESGHISIISDKSIIQNADISTNGSTIDLYAQNDITMGNESLTQTLNEHVQYLSSEGDITINRINADTGNVAIVANSGNIKILNNLDSDNIISHSLLLKAGGSTDKILTNISVLAAETDGNLFVENTNPDGITIDEVTVSVNRVLSDGALSSNKQTSILSDLTVINNGSIALNSAGSVTVNDGDNDDIAINSSNGSGHILLNAPNDEILIQSMIDAGSGSISILAGSDLVIGGLDNTESIILTSGNGTIDIESGGSIEMFDGNIMSAGSNIRLHAASELSISSINAHDASVSLSATNIIDSGTDDIDIKASNLRILNLESDGGLGTMDNMIETSVDVISAYVNDNGLYLEETDGIKIDRIDDLIFNRVGMDGSLEVKIDTSQFNVYSIGDVYIDTLKGDICINHIVSQGHVTLNARTGSILDHADDTIADITAGESKNITLSASHNIGEVSQEINKPKDHRLELADESILYAYLTDGEYINIRGIGDLTIQEVICEGTIYFLVTEDVNINKIESTKGVNIKSEKGDILVNHIETQRNINLLSLTGDIRETLFDITPDLIAGEAYDISLVAFGHIAGPDNQSNNTEDDYIDLSDGAKVIALSSGSGNINLRGEGNLKLWKVETADGHINAIAQDQIFANIVVSRGSVNDDISINSLQGDLIINKIQSAENINLKADLGSIIDHADDTKVNLTAGQDSLITLFSKNNIHGNGDDHYLEIADNSHVIAKAAGGDIQLQGEGSLRLQTIETDDGIIDIIAESDIVAEQIINYNTTNEILKNISIISKSGSIEASTISSYQNIYMNAGKSIINRPGLISANDAVLLAKTGIASSSQFLTLDVNHLDAYNQSTNGMFIESARSLTLSDLTNNNYSIYNQGNGDIVIVTSNGDITANNTIKSSEDGDILLLTQSEGNSIILNDDIITESGNLSIVADSNITQSSNVMSGGTIDFQTLNGNIFMADGIQTLSKDSNISYQAKKDIFIENINSGSAFVNIISETGKIETRQAQDHVHITAKELRLNSADTIGDSSNHLLTSTETIAAASKDQMFIENISSLTIGKVDPIEIKRVQMNGATSVVKDDQSLEGLVSESSIWMKTVGELRIGNIDAGLSSVSIIAGSIIDNEASDIDIIASNLRIKTNDESGGAGQKDNMLDLFVDTLSANVGEGGLFIHEIDGLTIDTVPEVDTIDQTQSNIISKGDVVILSDEGDILVNYIESENSIYLTANDGNILQKSSDENLALKAGDNNKISLSASGHISGQVDNEKYLVVSDKSSIDAKSTSKGNILLKGAGDLILNDIQTSNGKIDILASKQIHAVDLKSNGDEKDSITIHSLTGDILVGSVNSGDKVIITSDKGAILDDSDDEIVDITANQEIVLTSSSHIYGNDDKFIELADNSIVSATTSQEGSIYLKGAGALTLKNIISSGGAIEVIADNDIMAENVFNYDNGNNILNDITLESINGNIDASTIFSYANLHLKSAQAIIDKPGLVSANKAIISATTGIGENEKPLTLSVNQLDASNSSKNGIFINNEKDLILIDLTQDQKAIENVGGGYIKAIGSITIEGAVDQGEDFVLSAGNNQIIEPLNKRDNNQSDIAELNIYADIIHKQGGNIHLQAQDNINHHLGTISSESGSIKIISEKASIEQDGGGLLTNDLILNAAQEVNYISGTNQANLLTAKASNKDFAYTNQNDIYIDQIISGGSVSITSLEGSISDDNDAQAVDIISDAKIIRLVANHSITGIQDNALELDKGSRVFAFSEGAGDIRLSGKEDLVLENVRTNNGSVFIEAEKDMTIGSMDVGNNVFLTAKDGSIQTIDENSINIKANQLTIDSTNGIHLSTDISEIEALISGSGDLSIQEADHLNIKDIKVNDGNIDIQTNGELVVDHMAGPGDINLYASSGGMKISKISANNITAQSLSGDMAINKMTATNDVTLNIDSGELKGIIDPSPDINARNINANIEYLGIIYFNCDNIHMNIEKPNIYAYRDYLKTHLFGKEMDQIVLDDYFDDSLTFLDTMEDSSLISQDLSWTLQSEEVFDSVSDIETFFAKNYIPFNNNPYENESGYEVKWADFESVDRAVSKQQEESEGKQQKQSETKKHEIKKQKHSQSSDEKESNTNKENIYQKEALHSLEKIETKTQKEENTALYKEIMPEKLEKEHDELKHISREQLRPEKGLISKMRGFFSRLGKSKGQVNEIQLSG